MTRALALTLLLVGWGSVGCGSAGCGSTSAAPASEPAPSGTSSSGTSSSGTGAARPVRVADHATEAEPEPETVPVTAVDDDGPRADPPPVEPPSFED